MTIRLRLLLLVLSVLLPTVVAALWLIAQTHSAEHRALERSLQDTTRALAMVVGRELDQRAAVGRVLASSPNLDGAPDITPEALLLFEQQARRAMQGLDGWVELSAPGRALLSTGRGARSFAGVVRVGDADGLVELPVIGPLASEPGGELRARLVQPVQRDGRTRLNLAVIILPSELQRIIDQQHLPAGWAAAVLDGHGTIVARHPGGASHAGRTVTAAMKARLAAAREGLFNSVTLEEMVVTSYFSTSPQGWTYVTAMPRAQFAAGVPTAVLRAGVAALLLLGVTVAAAMWVARRIALPVQSLKRAAADMQAGRPVEWAATRIVEFDEVAAALAKAAEGMRDAQADLERQVEQAVASTRTAEQRISQGQRVEALGRLTGGVAHDFNNLLGVVSNSAHLIDRQAAGRPELRAPVAATLRAVEVGSRLTQHLMRFAGRQPVRPRAVHLEASLKEAQELLKIVLGSRIELSVAVAPATWPVTVDPSELELALINVALNARDAMPGGGHVWLKARNAEPDDVSGLQPGPYVLLTVTDDGSGIDEDLAQRAFEPFFTTKGVGKGTGLGLSQVHGFCVQAGGSARLASTPGLGTTVSLVLPARLEADEVRAPAVAASATEGVAHGTRVLLVEDNEELGDATAALLASFGCHLQRATSPDEAMRLLEAGTEVDVVLSDVVMPGGTDGVTLARRLRHERPDLPVVLISGYNATPAAAGDFVVLRKPCSPQELMAALLGAMAPKQAS